MACPGVGLTGGIDYLRKMFKIFRPIPAASLRLLVFDLDGTLIDSGADLCASVNAMLRAF